MVLSDEKVQEHDVINFCAKREKVTSRRLDQIGSDVMQVADSISY
jgi:hypothetical protein